MNQSTLESFLYLFIIGVLVFAITGGFTSDENLKVLYPSSGDNAIFADANEIRYTILPLITLAISLPLTIIISIFRYKSLLKGKSYKSYLQKFKPHKDWLK